MSELEEAAMTIKEKNREELQKIADIGGDLILMEMFWDMFDGLSVTMQKTFIERAKTIIKDQTGIEYKSM